MPFTRRCSAHAARNRKGPGSFPPPKRAPSSAPFSPRERRRPREGDAERVDRRHGSSVSSHGSPLTGGAALSTSSANQPRGASTTRTGSLKDPVRENERARRSDTPRAPTSSWETAGRSLRRRATVGEANADRGDSLARRRIHGSRACPRVEHVLQISVAQSLLREAVRPSSTLVVERSAAGGS